MQNRLTEGVFLGSIKALLQISVITTALVMAGCGGEVETAPDASPDPFTIKAVNDVALNAEVKFGPITVTGIDAPAMVVVLGGTVSIEGGAYSSAPSHIENGQTFWVKTVASSEPLTDVIGEIHIGDFSTSFRVRTRAFLDTDGSDPDMDNDGVANHLDPAPVDSQVTQVLRWLDTAPAPVHHHIDSSLSGDVQLADLNSDGLPDIVAFQSGVVSWRKNLGMGSFAAPQDISDGLYDHSSSVPYSPLGLVDIDADSQHDVIFLGSQTYVFRYTGENVWQKQVWPFESSGLVQIEDEYYFTTDQYLMPYNSQIDRIAVSACDESDDFLRGNARLVYGDFNGDGTTDFVANHLISYQFYQFTSGRYQCESLNLVDETSGGFFAVYPSELLAHDIDSDGRHELLVSYKNFLNPFFASVVRVDLDDTPLVPVIVDAHVGDDADALEFSPLGSRDFDGDHDVDLVSIVRGGTTSDIIFYENQGTGVFRKEAFTASTPSAINRVALVDVDNNGITDLYAGEYWLERRAYRTAYLFPEAPFAIHFSAVSEDGVPVKYAVEGPEDWASIDPQTGELSIQLPGGVQLDKTYYDFWVSASDGASTLRRLVRIYVSSTPDDFDTDGVANNDDAFPHDPLEWSDIDGDLIGDNYDADMDNDGVANVYDLSPTNKDRSQTPFWEKGGNDFTFEFLNASGPFHDTYSPVAARLSHSPVAARLSQADREEIIFVSYSTNAIAALRLNSAHDVTQRELYSPPQGCRTDDLLAHPGGHYALFVERCDEDTATVVHKLDYETEEVSRLGRIDGIPGFLFFARLVEEGRHDLTYVRGNVITFFNLASEDFLAQQITLDAQPSVLSGREKRNFVDVNHDGLDDFFGEKGEKGEQRAMYINTGNHHFEEARAPFLTQRHRANSMAYGLTEDGRLYFVSSDDTGMHLYKYSGNLEFNHQVICTYVDEIDLHSSKTCGDARGIIDVNLDGALDIIAGVGVWMNDGQEHYRPEHERPVFPEVHTVQKGDFDGDGVMDFLNAEHDFILVEFLQATPRYTAMPGEILEFQETVSILDGQTFEYALEPGLDASLFAVDAETGRVQFDAPVAQVIEDRHVYKAWLVARSPYTQTRKLLEVEVEVEVVPPL